MWTRKATKQLPELNILRKLFHSAVAVFHLNARLSFHQHVRQKHRASVSLTLGGWPGSAASVCGSPPAAGCCPTLNPHCISGPERSSPDSALQGLEQVGAQHNQGAPARFKDRGMETRQVLNEKTESNEVDVTCSYKRFTYRLIIDRQECAKTSGDFGFPFIR